MFPFEDTPSISSTQRTSTPPCLTQCMARPEMSAVVEMLLNVYVRSERRHTVVEMLLNVYVR